MEFSELEQRYRYLVSMPLSNLFPAGTGQYTGTLLEGGWIRILLIRYSPSSSDVRLEVELRTSAHDGVPKHGDSAVQMIQAMVSYFRYLMSLVKSGFELDVVENSCVWSVYKEFHGEIDEPTLRMLLPPTEAMVL
jgi:hypothetical protein